MHIKTVHRHFVAAPLLALFLLMPLILSGSRNLRADTLGNSPLSAGSANEERFSFPDGMYGIVAQDGRLAHEDLSTRLYQGDALVAAQGLSTLDAAGLRLQGFHGAFYVSVSPTSVSVAALTTPVLLAKAQYRLIIPAGFQGRFDPSALPSDLDPLQSAGDMTALPGIPDDFMSAQLQALSRLTPPETGIDFAESLPVVPTLLQFPAAQARETAARLSSFLTAVDEAIKADDQEQVTKLLEDPLAQTIPSSLAAQRRLPVLLADSLAHPGVTLTVLSWTQDPDLWLLASSHPELQAAAWAATLPATVPDAYRTLRILAFPVCDLAAEPAPQFARGKWAQSARDLIASQKDPKPLVAALLSVMDTYRESAQRRQFPQRLQDYSDALAQMADPSQDLDDATRIKLQEWH